MNNELYHHGVLGMKWGVRRYQNYDGTLKHPNKRSLLQKTDNLLFHKPKTEKESIDYSVKRAGKEALLNAAVGTAFMYKIGKMPLKECVTMAAVYSGTRFINSVTFDAIKYKTIGRVNRDYLKIPRRR